jgi:hypothetical protein
MVTIAELAIAKGLPEALFRLHGIRDDNGRIVIPYRDEQGNETKRPRIRTALRAADGSHWGGPRGDSLETPYGAWRLDEFRPTGKLAITEGETDCLTLWHLCEPAIGIPGATMWQKMLRPDLFRGFNVVIVFRHNDPDGAGDRFARGGAGVAAAAGVERVRIIRPPDGCKDLNDWYRRDPAVCLSHLQAAINATPLFDPAVDAPVAATPAPPAALPVVPEPAPTADGDTAPPKPFEDSNTSPQVALSPEVEALLRDSNLIQRVIEGIQIPVTSETPVPQSCATWR